MRGIIILLLSMAASCPCFSQQVIQIRWPSHQAAAPVTFGTTYNQWLPAFRFALNSVSEETLVVTGLCQGPLLGLNTNAAQHLQNLFVTNYGRLRQAEPFRTGASALPYCFSERQPTNGLATVYVPASLTTNTSTIVFLHGYGGSLLVYLHTLATIFPDHLILCPAYGISCANIPQSYVNECLTATAARFPCVIRQPPLLVGLSAGGIGACHLYTRNTTRYQALIAIASMPSAEALKEFNAGSRLRFVAGGAEQFVADGTFQQRLLALSARVRNLQWETIQGADHFFLLSHPQEIKQILLKWSSP